MTVYDVVLIPPSRAYHRAIAESEQLRNQYNTRFTLDDQNRIPHMSLYMAEFDPQKEAQLIKEVKDIASITTPLTLKATQYKLDPDPQAKMYEVQYNKTIPLISLQDRILKHISPLRSTRTTASNQEVRWPEQDPVNHRLDSWIPTLPKADPTRYHFEMTGYNEVDGNQQVIKDVLENGRRSPAEAALAKVPASENQHRPHITLTRFDNVPTNPIRPLDRSVDNFNEAGDTIKWSYGGIFNILALCKMGENGTCETPIAAFKLTKPLPEGDADQVSSIPSRPNGNMVKKTRFGQAAATNPFAADVFNKQKAAVQNKQQPFAIA